MGSRGCGGYLRLAGLAVLIASPAGAQWPWRDLEQGPHGVGYRVVREYDRSRTFAGAVDGAGEIDRLMELRIWYPAAPPAGAEAMTYSGYGDVEGADGPTGPLTDTLWLRFERDLRLSGMRFGRDSVALPARLLESRTGAFRNAPAAPGSFPAIIYAPGRNDSSDDNVVLWEYLASHGYVVGAVASQGVNTVSVLPGSAGVEAGVRDMEWALARLLGVPEVDGSRIGVAGFSFGGTAALLLAMRNVRVRGVVALDPSFGFERGGAALRASASFDSASFRTPVLVAAQRGDQWSSTLLDALRHAPRFTVRLGGMSHSDFCSYGMAYRNVLPGAARDSALRFKTSAYVGVATYVREFLDGYMKGDGARQLALRSKPRWRSVRGDDIDFQFQLGSR